MELHRKINIKNEKKSRCYEKVLELCHKRIINFTEREKTSCVFDFPEYVIGYPLFDLNACMQYCQKQLLTGGFLVDYYFPNRFYISWDFEEIKRHRAEQRKQIPLVSMLPPAKSKNMTTTVPQLADIPSMVANVPQQSLNTPQQHLTSGGKTFTSTPLAALQLQQPQRQHPESTMMSKTPYNEQPPSLQRGHEDAVKLDAHTIANITHEPLQTFWSKQQQQAPSSLQLKMTAPLPSSPPKYDPFDVLTPVIGTTSLSSRVVGSTSKSDNPTAIENSFFTNGYKQMLTSGIGNKQMFDYKPSGKLSLNI